MCSLSVIFNWRNCHKHKLPNQLTAKTRLQNKLLCLNNHHTTTILRPFYRDDPGEPVPEENFWTLWCKRRLTEADTPTIQLGGTPSGLSSAHLHHPHIFYRPDALPAAQPAASSNSTEGNYFVSIRKLNSAQSAALKHIYFYLCYFSCFGVVLTNCWFIMTYNTVNNLSTDFIKVMLIKPADHSSYRNINISCCFSALTLLVDDKRESCLPKNCCSYSETSFWGNMAQKLLNRVDRLS